MNIPVYSKEAFSLGPGDEQWIEVSVEGGFEPDSFYIIREVYKDALVIASVNDLNNTVRMENISPTRSFQVEKGDLIGFYKKEDNYLELKHEITNFEAQIEEAFAEISGRIYCPLCNKTYKSGTRGEDLMREHVKKEHETII